MSELLRTIKRQPEILAAVLDLPLEEAAAKIDSDGRVFLVGTGTSQHAAELGAQMFCLAGIDATWESSASFARRRQPPRGDDTVVLISHTGETAFSRQVRDQAMEAARPLVSITGAATDWPEAMTVAPRESSETYTAGYTAALMTLARLAGALGAKQLNEGALAATIASVRALVDRDPETIGPPDRLLAIVGAGPSAVTAREGALKVREAARIPSEGFEAEYLLHGSAVPLGAGDRLVLLQPSGDPDGLTAAIGDAAEAEGIKCVTIADESELDPLLIQIPLTVRLQQLACHLAERGGHDPDVVIEGAWGREAMWDLGS